MLLFVVAYAWCGMPFVREAYLYHGGRKDPRHSFAMQFYPVYLAEGQFKTNLSR